MYTFNAFTDGPSNRCLPLSNPLTRIAAASVFVPSFASSFAAQGPPSDPQARLFQMFQEKRDFFKNTIFLTGRKVPFLLEHLEQNSSEGGITKSVALRTPTLKAPSRSTLVSLGPRARLRLSSDRCRCNRCNR